MARYNAYDLNQTKMIPVSYADQIVEGSFEHALCEIVEEHLDLSAFEKRYANDETGRLAYDPKLLLKIVLCGYYKGRWRRRAGGTSSSWRCRPTPGRTSRRWPGSFGSSSVRSSG